MSRFKFGHLDLIALLIGIVGILAVRDGKQLGWILIAVAILLALIIGWRSVRNKK